MNSSEKLVTLSIIAITAIFSSTLAFAMSPFGFIPCENEPKIQAARSKELQELLSQDQSDYREEMGKHTERPINVKKLEQIGLTPKKWTRGLSGFI